MSPPPCIQTQPPDGMYTLTAPGLTVDALHATLAPVAGLTHSFSFARSPRGGVPARGSAFGKVLTRGGFAWSGTVAAPAGQPAGKVLLLMITDEFVVFGTRVRYAIPEHDAPWAA